MAFSNWATSGETTHISRYASCTETHSQLSHVGCAYVVAGREWSAICLPKDQRQMQPHALR